MLVKLGIPFPGSDHPVAGKGQRSQQHLEELTSLVDGHIDLRESLAAAGRMPPIDPSNSLTRIGVGSTKLVLAAPAHAHPLPCHRAECDSSVSVCMCARVHA